MTFNGVAVPFQLKFIWEEEKEKWIEFEIGPFWCMCCSQMNNIPVKWLIRWTSGPF